MKDIIGTILIGIPLIALAIVLVWVFYIMFKIAWKLIKEVEMEKTVMWTLFFCAMFVIGMIILMI